MKSPRQHLVEKLLQQPLVEKLLQQHVSQMAWPVQNPEHLVRKMDAYKRDRQARIAEAKAAHEYSELLDCTFTPAITRTVPQATGPVVVRGLERYMELQVSAC